ncbi:MAG: hypothetical protein AB1629_07325 [Candidatus Omnitrophota bacterium]
MAMPGKIVRIILILLVIISLSLASVAAYLLQQEMQKNTALNSQLSEALKQNDVLKSSLESSRQDISRLSKESREAEEKIKTLNSDILTLETEKKNLAEMILDLKTQLTQSQKASTEASKKIDELKVQVEANQKQLDEALKEKEKLSSKLKELELKTSEGVKLEKIVVKPRKGGEKLEGKISSVNKKFKFVVINLGKNDGVEVGDIFTCIDNDKEIGQVSIEKVYETLSSANFSPNLQVKSLKEGLKVVRE